MKPHFIRRPSNKVKNPFEFSTYLQIDDIIVEAKIDPGQKECVTGPVDLWEPGYGPSVDGFRVFLERIDKDKKKIRIEITDFIDKDANETIEEDCLEAWQKHCESYYDDEPDHAEY